MFINSYVARLGFQFQFWNEGSYKCCIFTDSCWYCWGQECEIKIVTTRLLSVVGFGNIWFEPKASNNTGPCMYSTIWTTSVFSDKMTPINYPVMKKGWKSPPYGVRWCLRGVTGSLWNPDWPSHPCKCIYSILRWYSGPPVINRRLFVLVLSWSVCLRLTFSSTEPEHQGSIPCQSRLIYLFSSLFFSPNSFPSKLAYQGLIPGSEWEVKRAGRLSSRTYKRRLTRRRLV